MLSWLPRRRARIARIDAEAAALFHDFGDAAYSEARRREHEASSNAIAKDWSRVALAIAEKTGKPVGLETATRMTGNADFSADHLTVSIPKPHTRSELGQIEELNRILGAKPPPFRVLFVGAAPGRGLSVLKEVERQVSDVSSAIVAAARLETPPHTVGLGILDREGREVLSATRPIAVRSAAMATSEARRFSTVRAFVGGQQPRRALP